MAGAHGWFSLKFRELFGLLIKGRLSTCLEMTEVRTDGYVAPRFVNCGGRQRSAGISAIHQDGNDLRVAIWKSAFRVAGVVFRSGARGVCGEYGILEEKWRWCLNRSRGVCVRNTPGLHWAVECEFWACCSRGLSQDSSGSFMILAPNRVVH